MKEIIGIICALITAKVGFFMHGSVFFAICDFLFWPLVWLKWLIFQEVTLHAIQGAFSFFFQ